jgi:hypothetical protein
MTDPLIITPCPHCFDEVIIYENEINCNKFVHAYYKDNMEQVNPHLNKEMCEQLLKDNKIHGCGGAFTLKICNDKYEAHKCDHG